MCDSAFTDVAGQSISLSLRGQEIQAERKISLPLKIGLIGCPERR